jgi:predicted protein tyrosine phosphatase
MTKILFLCGKNRRRKSFRGRDICRMDGIEVSSVGTSVEAKCKVSADLLEWADRVFVMEQSQRRYLNVHFALTLKNKKIVCLDIPNRYGYMQPELVSVLRAKIHLLLRRS